MAYRDERELELRIAFFGLPGAGKSACLECLAYELPGPPMKRTMSGSSEAVLRPLGTVRKLKAGVIAESLRRETFGSIQRQNLLGTLDAVAWIVDTQAGSVEPDREALAEFRDAFRAVGRDPDALPMVFLWNKSDLPPALPLETFRAALNPGGAPEFATVAKERRGVVDALRGAVRLVLVREGLA